MNTEKKKETSDNIFRPGFDLNNYEKFAIKGFRDIRLVEDVGQNEHIVGVPVVGVVVRVERDLEVQNDRKRI